MKKILDYRCYISTDGKHYFDTSIRYHLTYAEPKEQKVTVIMTFDDLVRVVKNGAIMNAELTRTFFRRKPMVKLRQGWDNDYFVTEKNFKPIYVKEVWEELTEQKSFSKLADMLPAEEFVEYVIDRGMSGVNI